MLHKTGAAVTVQTRTMGAGITFLCCSHVVLPHPVFAILAINVWFCSLTHAALGVLHSPACSGQTVLEQWSSMLQGDLGGVSMEAVEVMLALSVALGRPVPLSLQRALEAQLVSKQRESGYARGLQVRAAACISSMFCVNLRLVCTAALPLNALNSLVISTTYVSCRFFFS